MTGPSLKTQRRMAVVRECHSLEQSQTRIAELLGIARPEISRLAKALGLKFNKAWASSFKNLGKPNVERADAMAALYRDGYILEDIGKLYGITRERVRQILSKHKRLTASEGGQHVRAQRRQEKREAQREARFMRRHGCTYAQWCEVNEIGKRMVAEGRGVYQTPLYAFRSQRQRAADRGIGWELTFWQWWTLWQQSGHWDERGKGQGYVMCRNGDTGPYAIGNVYFARSFENIGDGVRIRFNRILPIGVSERGGKYEAYRQIDGKKLYLGIHDTPDLAYAAYLVAKPEERPTRRRQVKHGLPSGVSISLKSVSKPYRAYFYVGRKQHHVGNFATVDEAVAARNAALTPQQQAA